MAKKLLIAEGDVRMMPSWGTNLDEDNCYFDSDSPKNLGLGKYIGKRIRLYVEVVGENDL